MNEEFQTERLLIRPTILKDAPLVYQVLNTPKFRKHVGDRKIDSVKDAEDYIKTKMFPQIEELGYGNYTIERKTDGAGIGTCGLYNREGIEGIDVGFGILPEFEGFGYAFEATHRLIRAAFEDFEIEELKAITSSKNLASQGLLLKLGLQKMGTTSLPNDEKELYLFKTDSKSWLASQHS